MTQGVITLHTLWVWPSDYEGPEMALAWDEFTIDANPTGWEQAVDKALAMYEDGVRHRLINVKVPYEPILAAFLPSEAEADVEGA